MGSQPNLVVQETVDQAWTDVLSRLGNQEDGSLINLLVHVNKPNRDVPAALLESADVIERWAIELQSTLPQTLPFTHGERIRRWIKGTVSGDFTFFDQINDYVIPMLARNRKTKRAVVQVGDPSQDALISDDPIPALQLIQFTITDGLLDCTAYYRAQEMYFFWLVNVFELINLQEFVCSGIRDRNPQLELRPGSITTFAFVGYATAADLSRKMDQEVSSTLAIERLGTTHIQVSEFEELLTNALIENIPERRHFLVELLERDLQKLDRVRDIDYRGIQLLYAFLDDHKEAIHSELPLLVRNMLLSLIALRTEVEEGNPLDTIRIRLGHTTEAWQSVLNQLRVLA